MVWRWSVIGNTHGKTDGTWRWSVIGNTHGKTKLEDGKSLATPMARQTADAGQWLTTHGNTKLEAGQSLTTPMARQS